MRDSSTEADGTAPPNYLPGMPSAGSLARVERLLATLFRRRGGLVRVRRPKR
jgi:hypothetical protein